MKKINKKSLEIEYNDLLLEKIRQANNKSPDEEVTEDEIVEFFKQSLSTAINKDHAIYE